MATRLEIKASILSPGNEPFGDSQEIFVLAGSLRAIGLPVDPQLTDAAFVGVTLGEARAAVLALDDQELLAEAENGTN